MAVGVEGREEHDAGVIDQDVGAAQLGLDAISSRGQGVIVGDIGLDGNCAIAQFIGKSPDPVGASREQGEPEAAGGQGMRCSFADAGGSARDDCDTASGLVRNGGHGQVPSPGFS